jgi:hypothetical protein
MTGLGRSSARALHTDVDQAAPKSTGGQKFVRTRAAWFRWVSELADIGVNRIRGVGSAGPTEARFGTRFSPVSDGHEPGSNELSRRR